MFTSARKAVEVDPDAALFAAIGRFLADHRLTPEPAHYAFAHRLLADPAGPLARTVAALTDGGVRLTTADVAALGVAPTDGGDAERAAALIAETETQVREFSGLMDRMRAETSGFGRDLAASVDALDGAAAPELMQLTATMLGRVRTAEAQLEQANHEAETLREQLEEARGDARSDSLTGLPNRRALVEDFAARQASGAPMCLAVCDIDHFKRINDCFGHAIGDRVLRAIATELDRLCNGALVARYGGEEFALVFAGTDAAAAAIVVDRARAAIAAKHYKLRDDNTPLGAVTFSGGIAAVQPGDDFETAFARADALLYAAKDAGRNRIHH